MLNKISSHLDFFQRSLDLRAAKAEVIASNIANADTLATRRWILISARR